MDNKKEVDSQERQGTALGDIDMDTGMQAVVGDSNRAQAAYTDLLEEDRRGFG